jgi:hypothetical protein
MTCSRQKTKVILKINNVQSKSTPTPFINLKLGPGYSCKWFFDTGAAIFCIVLREFRKTFNNIDLIKINNARKVCQRASGAAIVPVGTYLIPLEWQEKKIIYPVIVFNKLNTPLIKGIDAIHHMGIKYLSTFLFQEDKIGENYLKKLT